MRRPTAPTSPRRRALGRFTANRLGFAGLVILVVFVLASVLGNLVLGGDPNAVDIDAVRAAPGSDHWLGTDDVGRDVLARLFAGGQVSLFIGFVTATVATVVGMVLGLTAGYVGGVVDSAIMRAVDALLTFPLMVVVLAMTAILGPSVGTIVLVIALFQWPLACRVVRATTMSVKAREYVRASRALGVRSVPLIVRHVIPAVMSPLTVVVTVLAAYAILIESALSFLGLGVSPPQASWGGMLSAAQSLAVIDSLTWLWIPPGLCIALTVLSINFVGDALRDALDTRIV